MLITSHFVYVHMKKTGGRFIRNLCREHLPAGWIVPHELGDHAAAREIPAEYTSLPVLGFVRNPWDWYVSWYHYVRQQAADAKGIESLFWSDVFDHGRASFKEAITSACIGVPAGGGPVPEWMERLQRRRIDLYSLWCRQMFRGGFDGEVEIGRFERLREEFIAFLDRHAVPVGDGFAGHVMARPPDNVTRERGDYASYYDPELRDLVGEQSEVVDEYGYTFDAG
jgi:hypothetical protein